MFVRWMWDDLIFTSSGWRDQLHHSIQSGDEHLTGWCWCTTACPPSKPKPLASRLAATVTWGDMVTGWLEPLAFNHTAQKMKFSFGINKYPHMVRTGRSSMALDRCLKWPSVVLRTFRSERRVFVWVHAKKIQGISNYTANQFFFFLQRISHLEAIYSPHKEATISWQLLHILWVLQQKYFSLFLSVLCTNKYIVGLLKPLSFIMFFFLNSFYLCLLIYAIYISFLLSLSRCIN